MPEPSYGGPERRQFPRIPFWYIVRYKVYVPAKDVKGYNPSSLTSRSKDISLGGILLETNQYYAPSTILEIEIDVPLDAENHVYAKVLGNVIRSSAIETNKVYDTAVQFVSVPKEYKSSILRLINAFT